MLGLIKKVKSEDHVLEQYPACSHTAAHSRIPGRTESLSVLVLLPNMEGTSFLIRVTFSCF